MGYWLDPSNPFGGGAGELELDWTQSVLSYQPGWSDFTYGSWIAKSGNTVFINVSAFTSAFVANSNLLFLQITDSSFYPKYNQYLRPGFGIQVQPPAGPLENGVGFLQIASNGDLRIIQQQSIVSGTVGATQIFGGGFYEIN